MDESELLLLLDEHDSLVCRCAGRELTFADFLRLCEDFPFSYALDGPVYWASIRLEFNFITP